jgi:hypothetical protein
MRALHADMLYQIALGAISSGVNQPTFLALNMVVLLLWLMLAYCLFVTATSMEYGWLAPHCAAMLGVCSCLAGLLNWVIATVGLTSAEEQEAQLQCSPLHRSGEQEGKAAVDTSGMDPDLAQKLRELPLHSDIDLALQGAGSFDTSGLSIQNLPSTCLLQDQHEKQKEL